MCYIPQCFALFAFISVLALFLLYNSVKSNGKIKFKSIKAVILISFPIYMFICTDLFKNYGSFSYILQIFSLHFSFAFLLAYLIVILSLVAFIDKNMQLYYALCILCSVFSGAYMLLIYPVNSRCYFYSYILLCCVAIMLFCKVEKFIDNSILIKCVCSVSIGIFAILLPLNISMHQTDKMVKEYVAYQIEQGEKVVAICNLTDSGYFHHSYASGRLGYTYYRNKPFDVQFKTVSVKSWMDDYYKNGEYKQVDD